MNHLHLKIRCYTFLRNSAPSPLITSPIRFQTGLQKLQSLSLVELRHDSGNSSLRMRDLIEFMLQDAARQEEFLARVAPVIGVAGL